VRFPQECGEKAKTEKGVVDQHSAFATLQSLSLENNAISSWQSVDEMRMFPSLTELRLRGNPVYDQHAVPLSRIIVIARLPQLERLNGSQVILFFFFVVIHEECVTNATHIPTTD
jgi:hypothetical protein